MRRFFHRKGTQARSGSNPAANGAQPGNRPRSSSSASTSPNHVPTGRVRAPALRSRSMSVLNGPTTISPTAVPTRRFSRSLSFCAENPPTSCLTRQLTKSEEDDVFRSYTRKVYGLFGVLCAIIVGIAIYAYLYNYGNRS